MSRATRDVERTRAHVQGPAMDNAPFTRLPLPLEVWYLVIEHLHSDTRSLKNCSLVCKAWRRRSQPCLFDVLSHSPREDPVDDQGLKVTSRPAVAQDHMPEDSPPRTLHGLASFLSASPHIARHVTIFIHDLSRSNSRNLSLPMLQAVLVCLPKLRNLRLKAVHFLDERARDGMEDEASLSPELTATCPLRPLTELHLSRCQFTVSSFYRLMRLFPSVVHLWFGAKLHHSAFDEAGAIKPSEAGLAPTGLQVNSLTITASRPALVQYFVVNVPTMAKSITWFSLYTSARYTPATISSLLAHMPFLSRLDLVGYVAHDIERIQSEDDEGRR
ncbi:hypothetical protein OH76DRAFT_1095783 [Lentinus brumalis]|uniref:F-box domain-containing protein n=1 Tax=Lentinus brumalis TaxID=2498619 RepID=A0A371CW49_9APHY|nr:hypothetical protein OH76DRAFT_1095783 [Polyporus brumalis]